MLNHQFVKLNEILNNGNDQLLKYDFKRWDNQSNYEGTFLNNSLHGYGTLKRHNSYTYEGNFYSNCKEGYAAVSLPDNSYFEGLFIQNQPFGPGILTYSSGRQDVGFWVGSKLVRLIRPVDFIVPRLAATLSAKIKLLLSQHLIPTTEKNFLSIIEMFEQFGYRKDLLFHLFAKDIYDPRSFFFDAPLFDKTYFGTSASNYKNVETNKKSIENVSVENNEFDLSQSYCNKDVMLREENLSDNDICYDYTAVASENLEIGILGSHYRKLQNIDESTSTSFEKYLEVDGENEVDYDMERSKLTYNYSQAFFPNKGELCTDILKLIFRYRAFEGQLNFKIGELLTGIRTAFRSTGEKERVCLQFLKTCSTGPPKAVKYMLCNNEISEELMDSRGNNAVMFAVASDQREIIDILLDYGVNVNSFNDENLTPLNLCLLRRLAQANDIYSWETAFLPPVSSEKLENERKLSDFPAEASIQSLDRVIGDGMSIVNINENKNFNLNGIKPVTSSKLFVRRGTKSFSGNEIMADMQSQITILNFERRLENDIGDGVSSTECVSVVCGNHDSNLNMRQKMEQKLHKKEEFDKSVSKSSNDKYLFQIFSDESNEDKKEKSELGKDENVASKIEQQEPNSDLHNKLLEIDKTIEKLLQRGADPNISEVPRPSIHLAIFTKNKHLVELFLRYGANPNSQLNFNEGLLAPLHVLVLIKPSPEYINICELLLNYGADPEQETEPNFCIWEGEKNFLNDFHGRTPLQLLCMRPDLKQEDPNGYLIKIGLNLIKVSDKKHLYNGRTYLDLAKLTGNIKLLKEFLQFEGFDLNEELGQGLDTTLQVLESKMFQQGVTHENSLRMSNLLFSAGANSLLRKSIPLNLRNSSVTFSRQSTKPRELQSTNSLQENGKQRSKSKNSSSENNLKNYSKNIQSLSAMGPEINTRNRSQADSFTYKKKTSENKNIKLTGFSINTSENANKKLKSYSINNVKKIESDVEKNNKNETEKENKINKNISKMSGYNDDTQTNKNELKSQILISNDVKSNKSENAKIMSINNEAQKKKSEDDKTSRYNRKQTSESDDKNKMYKFSNIETNKKKDKSKASTHEYFKQESKKNNSMGENIKKATMNKKITAKENSTNQKKSKAEPSYNFRDFREKSYKNKKLMAFNATEDKRWHFKKRRPDIVIKFFNEEASEHEMEHFKKKKIYAKGFGGQFQKRHGQNKSVSQRKAKRMFPRALKNSLLNLFGNCVNIDVNQFYLPYAVLRDGNFYYRFKNQSNIDREQYSLI